MAGQKYNPMISASIYHDLIESIVASLEARDVHTANHSRRVSDMTERFCRFLEISEAEGHMIHMAAHVHDIGKIGIPDSILQKPGKLSPQERIVMKQHSQIGASILGRSACLKEIANIVLHHHERWDGRGYPGGLAGESIPYGSRVIAVCDSVDAMLGLRSYRESLTADECRREILENCGKMYDPAIANSLILHWNEIVPGYESKCGCKNKRNAETPGKAV